MEVECTVKMSRVMESSVSSSVFFKFIWLLDTRYYWFEMWDWIIEEIYDDYWLLGLIWMSDHFFTFYTNHVKPSYNPSWALAEQAVIVHFLSPIFYILSYFKICIGLEVLNQAAELGRDLVCLRKWGRVHWQVIFPKWERGYK